MSHNTVQQIQKQLDKIMPYMQGHAGGVEIVDFNDTHGELKLKFTGNCDTCPYVGITYKHLVKQQLSGIPGLNKIDLV